MSFLAPTAPSRDRLLLNDGKGNLLFAPDDSMPPRHGDADCLTVQIIGSDFDGDGGPDLIMVETRNYVEPYLQLLLNNRDGTFRDASEIIPRIGVPKTTDVPTGYS